MSRWKGHRVAVIAGGKSGEREVSLRSGKAIHAALAGAGHDVVLLDAGVDLPSVLRQERAEVVYNGLHGRWGEDGCVQGLLEWMELPYTGSGVEASAIAMDKVLTKQMAMRAGVPTPAFAVPSKWNADSLVAALEQASIGFPIAVKPNREGSSLGFRRLVDKAALEDWIGALAKSGTPPRSQLVEAFHEGRELTASVLDDEALPLVEIKPKSGLYDYQSKYTAGASEYFCPAPVTPDQREAIQNHAVTVHRLLGCSGATRSDFILDREGRIWFLEINTLPGMTATSLLPKAAAAHGMDFTALVGKILETASLKGM